MPAGVSRRAGAVVAWLQRRPFHAVVGVFAVGLAASEHPRTIGAVALGVLALAASLAAAGQRGLGTRLALAVSLPLLVGAAIGSSRVHAIDAAAYRARSGTVVAARATLVEHPRPSRFGSSAVLRIESGPARGAPVLARTRARTWPASGEPGRELVVRGELVAPAATSGAELDWPAYLRRRGIRSELRLEAVRATGRSRTGVAGSVDALRRRGERALAGGMRGERAAVARGMVLGEDERIDPLLRDDFRRSGLAHVLAVSGQNVMLLCALAAPLLGGLGLGPRARVAALLVAIAVYVPLAGAGASLQRAGVMGAAGLIALAAGRPASRWYALLVAAAGTLLVNPRVGADPGWQLSFAAVAGILVLVRPLRRLLGGLPAILAEGIAVTVAATLTTAPLLAHHFGRISLVSLAANLVALPVVAPIMWLGMVQVGLGLARLYGPAAAVGHVTGLLVGWLDGLARHFAELPGAQVALALPTWPAVAAAYLAIGVAVVVAVWMGRRAESRARELGAAWRRAPVRHRTALVAAGAAALAAGWTHVASAPAPPNRLTVSFLDVGQGDATLIQDGAGASVLFDGGPPEARVYRRLRAAGVGHLDLAVATHQSRDHQGGLHEVLARIPTEALLENGDGTHDPDYLHLLAEARARHVRVMRPYQGELLRVGRLAIRVLGPPARAPGPPPDDPNPRGIAAVVSEGSFDLFLSADAESDAILGYPLPPVEAMKVSHHGSADPGLPEVLDRLRPEVAAIEVGAHNTYGHPAPSTLTALRAAVPHVYRTDRDGTVRLTVGAGGGLRIATAK
ncbi:MAG: ComEC/Rec2 family competence protein [Thermoleophilaceae bacterium]